MPVTTTTYTCQVASTASLEYLLVATAAALTDTPLVVTAGSDRLVLEQVTKDAWSEVTTCTQSLGWLGATRALSGGRDATAESWLEATDLTLVTIAKQQQGKADAMFAAAATDFVQRLETHFFTRTYLVGDTATLTDALVATALGAVLARMPTTLCALPQQVYRWMQTVLHHLQTVLPFTVIPSWRDFGLERVNCWTRWAALVTEGAASPLAVAKALPVVKAAPAAVKAAAKPAPVTKPATPVPATPVTPATSSDNAILQKLAAFNIAHTVYDHKLSTTAEELVANVPLPANESHTKNLFLRDKKHGHFLVTVAATAAVNTKELGTKLGLTGKVNLRLADAAILDAKLHVKPGCVGPLGMALAAPSEDAKEKVQFVLDGALLKKYDFIHSHPLVNTQSVKLTPAALQDYLKQAGVEPILLDFDDAAPAGAAPAAAKPPAPKPAKAPKPKAEKKKVEGHKEKKNAAQKGETKLALQVSKQGDFAQWYTDVIVLSEMISYYDISGCYILRPWSFKMWELITEWFNDKLQVLGVENSYFPMFVSQDKLEREKDHVAGFSPEVAWVTKSGSGDLAKPIAIRPTSETIMYPAFADWIQSHRDLPLKLNQWSNVVRWEFKYPTPFLRTREFLWQEGHTAHTTFEEANVMVMDALDLYRRVYEELLAVPVVPGYKTEKEKFAGGYRTTTVEAYIAGSGRAIQGATSHHLGQNFGKMFGINFQDDKGQQQTAWQTSWGLTTRTIGVMVMVHGDDTGLVLPPRIAPLQVVIVPIVSKKFLAEQADPYCQAILDDLVAKGLRAKYDDRAIYNPGWKYNHWEQKGVPIRIEVGPRDVENKCARVVIRHNGEKYDMAVDGMGAALVAKLEEIQEAMFTKAKTARDEHVVKVTEWKDFVPNLEKHNLVLTPWCGGEYEDWEEHVKDKSREESLQALGEDVEDEQTSTSVAAKTLCIPFDQPELPPGTKCLVSGMDATCWVLWGRSY